MTIQLVFRNIFFQNLFIKKLRKINYLLKNTIFLFNMEIFFFFHLMSNNNFFKNIVRIVLNHCRSCHYKKIVFQFVCIFSYLMSNITGFFCFLKEIIIILASKFLFLSRDTVNVFDSHPMIAKGN